MKKPMEVDLAAWFEFVQDLSYATFMCMLDRDPQIGHRDPTPSQLSAQAAAMSACLVDGNYIKSKPASRSCSPAGA